MSSQGFKDSPVGRVPVDWDVVRLSEIFDVITGTTPPTKEGDYWDDNGVVWVTPADMSDLKGLLISDSKKRVSSMALENTNLNLVPKFSIILSTRAPVGYVAINTVECVFNQGCKSLVPCKLGVNTTYFAYYFLSQKERLQNLSAGSTFRELNKETLKRIYLPLPSLEEQERIAGILRDMDNAIEKVDQAIEATEKLKRGLMQRLLTEGINHAEFKDSPVGRVPVDWDVVRLGDITTFIKGRKPDNLSDECFENALPYLTTDYLRFNNKIKFADSKKGIIVNEDDLILLWDGANAGEFFTGFEGVLASTMVKLDLDDRNISRDFLFYKLKTKEKFLKLQTVGTGIPHVNRSVINSLRISIPPLEEQERIAGILRDVDRRLELLNKRKEVLGNIKQGLMNDLLTGKRRVKIPA